MHEHRALLGFDFGSKRIGVAVGQLLTRTATPLGIVRNYNNRPDWPAITRLIKTWQPGALVVGVPLNLPGEVKEITRAAKKFMRQLNGRFHLSTYGVDECLSSREAVWRTGRTVNLDAIAAQIILETWLAQNPRPDYKRLTVYP